jgi:hypothetical protein
MIKRRCDGSIKEEGNAGLDGGLGKQHEGAEIQHCATPERKHDKLDNDE